MDTSWSLAIKTEKIRKESVCILPSSPNIPHTHTKKNSNIFLRLRRYWWEITQSVVFITLFNWDLNKQSCAVERTDDTLHLCEIHTEPDYSKKKPKHKKTLIHSKNVRNFSNTLKPTHNYTNAYIFETYETVRGR